MVKFVHFEFVRVKDRRNVAVGAAVGFGVGKRDAVGLSRDSV